MKSKITILFVFLMLFLSGCEPMDENQPKPTVPPASPTPAVEVITAQGGGPAAELPPVTPMNDEVVPGVLPADGITLSENGMTFSMQVGENFLLNLGTDVYSWTVEIDHQDVLQREAGVTVIKGAQGIYVAQAPGTATLIASGDPLCLQSRPPCMRPSVLFSITLIVK